VFFLQGRELRKLVKTDILMNKSVIFFCLLWLAFGSCKREVIPSEFVDISAVDQYQAFINEGVTLVFFHSPSCGYCKQQRPEIEILFGEENLQAVGFGEVNYFNNPEIVTLAEVVGFPTIQIYKNGKLEHHLTGYTNKYEDLRAHLLKLL